MKKAIFFSIKKGFTLIELMIVIAIIAILATIAVPSYQNYTKKAAISELLQAAAPYRAEVELCIYNTDTPSECSAGQHGIRANISSGKKYLSSINVKSGVITVIGQKSLEGVNYTLSATGNAVDGVSWSVKCNGGSEVFPAGFCA
ncbi:prepilin peptidase-dependent pilin [Pasteurella multocida]|uniref:prepilin peptidase-dependent pilin n=1 Tax=Pasteurella multocida TaxID=747 RepID=UPI0008FA5E4C|nr:prepilin peptidase-dependent pilin [Pasteurella multocida]MDC4234809.1 prepilin peptidase-dependent pilin [Pasteurella multocida]OIQ14479.1 prepilin peptidase [Pasteurella multocida subsp. multocida]PNW24245.1 prepilin peptidase [Pasteurella multocida subsp. multocida]